MNRHPLPTHEEIAVNVPVNEILRSHCTVWVLKLGSAEVDDEGVVPCGGLFIDSFSTSQEIANGRPSLVFSLVGT